MSQQHPWGAPRHNQSTRLTPISTSAAHDQRNTPSPSGSRQPYSPAASSFPSLPSASSRLVGSRKSSAASSTSSAPFAVAGQQLPASQLLSSRSRTNTNQNTGSAAPGAASSNSNAAGSKLVRASPSSSTVGSPSTATNPTSGAPSQNLSRIVIAQVFLLLSQFGPVKDEKDRSKWDTQTEQIRKVRHWLRLYTSPLHDANPSLADRLKRYGGILKVLPACSAEQCTTSLRLRRPQHRSQRQLSDPRDRGAEAANRSRASR